MLFDSNNAIGSRGVDVVLDCVDVMSEGLDSLLGPNDERTKFVVGGVGGLELIQEVGIDT